MNGSNSSLCARVRGSVLAQEIFQYTIFGALSIPFYRAHVPGTIKRPMKFLTPPRYRLPYLLVFAVLSNELLNDITSTNTPESIERVVYFNILYKIFILPFILVFFLGIKFFPLLACVEASLLLPGHCIGLAYSVLWFCHTLWRVIFLYYQTLCVEGNTSSLQVASYFLSNVPVLCACLTVVIWFAVQIVKSVLRIQGDYDAGIEEYQKDRVRKLFSKPVLPFPASQSRVTIFLTKTRRYFFPYSKHYRLPLPFLCVITSIIMFLYQLSLLIGFIGFEVISRIAARNSNSLRPTLNATSANLVVLIDAVFYGIPIVFLISPFVSLFLCAFLLLHMVGSISKQVKSVAKEGFKEALPGKLALVPGAWTYLGSQFGYLVYAYLFYLLLFMALGVVIIVISLGFKFFTSYMVHITLILIIPTIWSRGVYYLQFLLCKYIFYENSEGKYLSITNRRLFNWFAYILFIYNGFAGFVGAIIRLALSAGVTLLLLFRLDTVVLPAGFEFLDFGHRAFLGSLYLDYSYNNAVVRTFIHLLLTRSGAATTPGGNIQGKASYRILENSHSPTRSSSRKKILQRNRWQLAYTLIRNPSLRDLRASNLLAKKEKEVTTPPSYLVSGTMPPVELEGEAELKYILYK